MKIEHIKYKKGRKTITTDLVKVTFESDDEWVEHRTDGIGASESGTLLGLNPFETPIEWYRKKKGIDPQPEVNEAMMRGHIFEDGVAKMFSAKTGLTIIENTAPNIVFYNECAPHRRVTPDRFGLISGTKSNAIDMSKRFILECKTHVGTIKYNEITQHFDYPKMWRVQVMKGLGICGCPFGYIAWLDSSLKVNYERIDFNQEDYDAICAVDDSTWDLFLNDIEPDVMRLSDIKIKYPKADPSKSVEFNFELQSSVMNIDRINKEIKTLQEEKAEHELIIKDALKDAEYAVDPSGIVLCSFKNDSSFNEEELKNKEPDVYDKYTRKVFDATSYKKDHAKEYKSYCNSLGKRVLRINNK